MTSTTMRLRAVPSANAVVSRAASRRTRRQPVRGVSVFVFASDDANAKEEGEAPVSSSFGCRKCEDTGQSACSVCKGNGYLPPGGYHAKNQVDAKTAVGSRWTAHRRTRGWRHFECVGASPRAKTLTLVATCDRAVSVDIPIKMLRDRMEWSMGWKQRDELEWVGEIDQPGGAVARPKGGTTCSNCKGEGWMPCTAKGCKEGLVKIERQRAVIEKVEKMFERQLERLREDADEDDRVAAERKMQIKKQLKATRDEAGKREKSRAKAARKKQQKLVSQDAGSAWSDYRNSQRDELLAKWIEGESIESDPSDQQ